jgi:hypothetical protein
MNTQNIPVDLTHDSEEELRKFTLYLVQRGPDQLKNEERRAARIAELNATFTDLDLPDYMLVGAMFMFLTEFPWQGRFDHSVPTLRLIGQWLARNWMRGEALEHTAQKLVQDFAKSGV